MVSSLPKAIFAPSCSIVSDACLSVHKTDNIRMQHTTDYYFKHTIKVSPSPASQVLEKS